MYPTPHPSFRCAYCGHRADDESALALAVCPRHPDGENRGNHRPMDSASFTKRKLLMRRIPRDEVILGRAYVIHARNGGVGVAVNDRGELGYRLHREKFSNHYLFVEYDWDNGAPFGTAIPMRLLEEMPPTEEEGLLAWLAAREVECEGEFLGYWKEVGVG